MPHAPHPSLKKPIPPEQFLAEFEATWKLLDFRPPKKVVFSQVLGRTHCKNSRRYAEMQFRPLKFIFAPQAIYLPAANRLGIFAHEIGHFLMGPRPHEEWMADAAAFDDLNIVIDYDKRWPGKGLQRGRYVR